MDVLREDLHNSVCCVLQDKREWGKMNQNEILKVINLNNVQKILILKPVCLEYPNFLF